MKGFGSRLRELRERQGLSQLELAQKVDLHMSQVSRYERENSLPTAEKLIRLARILGVSTDELLQGPRGTPSSGPIRNVRLLERFQALETLDRDDQDTAIKLIDALVAKRRLEAVISTSAS